MTKDKEIIRARQKKVYDRVKQAKQNYDKVEKAILEFAEDYFLSPQTVWKDYSQAIKEYGRIDLDEVI